MTFRSPATPWLTALSLAGATTLLFPLLSGYSWYLLVLTIIALITAVHWGLRRLRVPELGATVASVLLLLFALTAMMAHAVAPLGFWPGPAALAELRRVARSGVADAASQMAPAAPTTGLVLLVALAIGALTILAHALDEFDDLLGLGWPVLLIYASSATVLRHPVPWQWFGIAGATWLALVAGREAKRLQGFGPLATQAQNLLDEHLMSRSSTHTGASARRAGAAALAIALIVPVLLPAGHRLHFPGNGHGTGGGGGPGLGLISIDPTVSLRRDLITADNRVVLTYSGTYANGADAGPTYLRMDVLDTFDGTTWSSVPSDYASDFGTDQPWPLPPGLGSDVSLTGPIYTVALGPLDGRAIPVPALTGSLVIPGTWFYDSNTQTVRTSKESPAGKGYTAKTWDSNPTPDQLRTAQPASAVEGALDLTFPSNTPASVVALAQHVTASAHTQYDAAIAIQTWLRTFRYSTAVRSGDGTSALLTFIRDRTGYCQQFAATMALLARIRGIPARVAVGFAPGVRKSDGKYQVTVHDAHAWPELFFHGLGWIRFEPTPRDPATTGIAPPTFSGAPGAPTSTQPGTTANGIGKNKVLNRADSGGAVAAVTAPPAAPRPTKPPWGAGISVGVIALVLITFTLRTRRRLVLRRRHSGPEFAWAMLRSTAADLGAQLPNTLTPRQTGDRLAGLAPDDGYRESVDRIVSGIERARYSRHADSPDLHYDIRKVLRALRIRASWPTRIRALILPTAAD